MSLMMLIKIKKVKKLFHLEVEVELEIIVIIEKDLSNII